MLASPDTGDVAPVECLPLILSRPWGLPGVIFSSTYPSPAALSNILVSVLIGSENGDTQDGGRRGNNFAKRTHTSWKARAFYQSSSFFSFKIPQEYGRSKPSGSSGRAPCKRVVFMGICCLAWMPHRRPCLTGFLITRRPFLLRPISLKTHPCV